MFRRNHTFLCSYMQEMPPCVQACYKFDMLHKAAADHSLLDLTVTGAQSVANLLKVVTQVS